jgi:hypothetical protein
VPVLDERLLQTAEPFNDIHDVIDDTALEPEYHIEVAQPDVSVDEAYPLRLAVVVVLPTPPLPDVTTKALPTRDPSQSQPAGCADGPFPTRRIPQRLFYFLP